MRILIVDDSEEKRLRLIEAINTNNNERLPAEIHEAVSLASAVKHFSSIRYDLIFLDLVLPFVERGTVDSRAGLELIRQLRSEGGINQNTTVYGLSAFPDEIGEHRREFEAKGVSIFEYGHDSDWQGAIFQIVGDVAKRVRTTIKLDFLIFCALDSERNGYTGLVDVVSSDNVDGLNIQYVRPTGARSTGAIVRLSRMGLVCAAREVALALTVFDTPIVCMSGICAGIEEHVALGQLVVASPAWEYQAGKWAESGFEIAPEQVPLRPATRTSIDQLFGKSDFLNSLEHNIERGIPRPTLQQTPRLAPFATGSAVIADATRLVHIESQHRKLAAIDMETFGLYFSAFESTRSIDHFFSVKCVVDLADSAKNNELHRYGCCVSAKAALAIIGVLQV